MDFSNNSKTLISFINENKCIKTIKHTKNTNNIFMDLYNDINEGFNYINNLKRKRRDTLYKLSITKINNIIDIPKPTTFSNNNFPTIVREHINNNSTYVLHYSFSLFQRKYNFYFVVQNKVSDKIIRKYNNYILYILVFLHISNKYATHNCFNDLNVYLYFTELNKILPETNIYILNENNINTGFTTSCPSKNAEIVIYRKEEWFKVFIHESFHTFELDFSDMNNKECHNKILDLFPVNSEINLFEAYTEFWAEVINCCFCSYTILDKQKDIDEFLLYTELFINIERIYSFFQLVKILDFMDLKYTDLYSKKKEKQILRNNLYKEQTNVLSYYIIKLILISNYPSFLNWCNINNISLFKFKKTIQNQKSFCKYIESNYKSKEILHNINCNESFITKIKNKFKDTNMINFLLNNTRMTACELE